MRLRLTPSTASRGTGIAVLLTTCAALISPASSFAAADPCPNAAVRAQQDARGLPDCRAYEQVSPPEKFGYPITIDNRSGVQSPFNAASRSGDAALFVSFGSFAGSTHAAGPQTYHAVRAPTGWMTKAGAPGPTMTNHNAAVGTGRSLWTLATSDLTTGLVITDNTWSSLDGNQALGDPLNRDVYVVRSDAAHVELASAEENGQAAGAGLNPYGTYPPGGGYPQALSDDGRVVVFSTRASATADDAAPGSPDVYERRDGQTRLVSVAGATSDVCGSILAPSASEESNSSAVSEDGSRIIFQSGCTDFSTTPDGPLWMRIDGTETRELSASQRATPDPSGTQVPSFLRASPDGRFVVFSSAEALTDDADVGGSVKVYRYDVSTGVLNVVVDGLPDALAVGVSRDTSRLWVVTSDALYVADGGAVQLIASEPSNGVLRGDLALERYFVSTPTGDAIAFVTSAELGFNSGGKRQLYRYADGDQLRCVSCPPVGATPGSDAVMSTGSANRYAEKGKYGSSISDDGSRLAFQTRDALSPIDTNNRDDVYLWRDGKVSLISSGADSTNSHLVGLSATGSDLFFATAEDLVPQDVDGSDVDLYDARIDGGFLAAAVAETTTPCSEDQCQGERSGPPASLADLGPSNGSGWSEIASGRRARFTVAPVTAAQRRAVARSGRLSVRVRVNKAGTVTASARARKLRRVAHARRVVSAPGTVAIPLRLSKAARRELKHRHSLRLQLTVRFTGALDAQTSSVRLALPRARRATVLPTASQKGR